MAILRQGDTRGPAADPQRYSGWELINQGAFAVAYKAVRSGQPVFFKQYINPMPLTPWYHPFIAYQEKLVPKIRNTPALVAMCIYPIDHFDYQGVLRFTAAPGKTPASVSIREYCTVLPWHDGGTLGDVIASRQTADLGSLLDAARHLAAGLAELHEAGIVHGDLKPHAVLVGARAPVATVRLRFTGLDFAMLEGETIPWASHEGFIGTPGWMSPEHLRQPQVRPTAASDVFTVALMLNALLGEGHPFREPAGGRYQDGSRWEMDDAVLRGRFQPCQLLPVLRGKPGARALEEALTASWDPTPTGRPSLVAIRAALESLQAEVSR